MRLRPTLSPSRPTSGAATTQTTLNSAYSSTMSVMPKPTSWALSKTKPRLKYANAKTPAGSKNRLNGVLSCCQFWRTLSRAWG